jgi:thiamine biosynthesis lipoprotein
MATRFEIVLHGENPTTLRAAAEEALDEIQRLESKLSLYRPDSEIAQLNALASKEAVRVSPELFRLLLQARKLHSETFGAFDITVGPLMKLWGFMGTQGRVPSEDEIAKVLEHTGMSNVSLDADSQSVRFLKPGVVLDLGSIGKGYALERAAEFLREAGITSGLLHGGTSTSYAIGSPPSSSSSTGGMPDEPWKIAIENPQTETQPPPLLAVVPLRDAALSVSAVWGKSFIAGESTYGHVIDPRTGKPAERTLMAAVTIESPTLSDALSTALLVLGAEGHPLIVRLQPNARTLTYSHAKSGAASVQTNGIEVYSPKGKT